MIIKVKFLRGFMDSPGRGSIPEPVGNNVPEEGSRVKEHQILGQRSNQ